MFWDEHKKLKREYNQIQRIHIYHLGSKQHKVSVVPKPCPGQCSAMPRLTATLKRAPQILGVITQGLRKLKAAFGIAEELFTGQARSFSITKTKGVRLQSIQSVVGTQERLEIRNHCHPPGGPCM